jgi:hypothetical protein
MALMCQLSTNGADSTTDQNFCTNRYKDSWHTLRLSLTSSATGINCWDMVHQRTGWGLFTAPILAQHALPTTPYLSLAADRSLSRRNTLRGTPR